MNPSKRARFMFFVSTLLLLSGLGLMVKQAASQPGKRICATIRGEDESGSQGESSSSEIPGWEKLRARRNSSH